MFLNSPLLQYVSESRLLTQSFYNRFLRFVGTLVAIAVFQYRYVNYPADYAYVRTPIATFLFVAAELAEFAYVFVFKYVEGLENKGKGGKKL